MVCYYGKPVTYLGKRLESNGFVLALHRNSLYCLEITDTMINLRFIGDYIEA